MKTTIAASATTFLLMFTLLHAGPIGTSFNHSCQLKHGGSPANGNYDFEYRLFDAASGGNEVAAVVHRPGVAVVNGACANKVDFGHAFDDGQERWMEIRVRQAGSPNFTPLSRQKCSVSLQARHAAQSASAAMADVAKAVSPNAVTGSGIQNGTITAEKLVPGQVVKSLNGLFDLVTLTAGDNITITPIGNALQISATGLQGPPGPQGATGPQGVMGLQGPPGPSSADTAWQLLGNAGTTAGINFLGTTDDVPLELRVNNSTAFRFLHKIISGPSPAPALIGGSGANQILGLTGMSSAGATIGGGGSVSYPNTIDEALFAVISGGSGNTITNGAWSIITGGADNSISAWGGYHTIGGGYRNRILLPVLDQVDGNTIAGGYDNLIGQGSDTHIRFAFIGSGHANTNQSEGGVIGGGSNNRLDNSLCSLIGSGAGNVISDGAYFASIAGGSANRITGSGLSIIGGGAENSIAGASYTPNVIGGGRWNRVEGNASFVGGGTSNTNLTSNGFIGGGDRNTMAGGAAYSTITGGHLNETTWQYAAIGGGQENKVTGSHGTVPGGYQNEAASVAFAAGQAAKAIHSGSFVWGDASGATTESFGMSTFTVRASGGARFYTSGDNSAGVQLATGGGAWSSLSDRNVKKNVQPVNPREVLEKLTSLPLGTWNYKAQEDSIRHIGPMAQDFHAAFGVGEDERHINSVDADGVALAAIQGLHQVVSEKEARIADLENRLRRLEQLLADQLVREEEYSK
jgi:hypothetical protein